MNQVVKIVKPESINITDTFLWYIEITHVKKLLTVQNICTFIYFTKKINKIHCYTNCMTQFTVSFLTPTVHCHVYTLIVLYFTTKSATFQSSSTFLIRDGRYLTYQLKCLPAGVVTECTKYFLVIEIFSIIPWHKSWPKYYKFTLFNYHNL